MWRPLRELVIKIKYRLRHGLSLVGMKTAIVVEADGNYWVGHGKTHEEATENARVAWAIEEPRGKI